MCDPLPGNGGAGEFSLLLHALELAESLQREAQGSRGLHELVAFLLVGREQDALWASA